MPTTRDGLQRLLEFFLYGMLRASEDVGNPELFVRMVEEEGLRKFMQINMPRFQTSSDPVEACRAYTREVDAEGLLDGSDTVVSGDSGAVHTSVGPACTYRRVCTMRHDEGLPVHCIRGIALGEMLRVRLDEDFASKLESFGLPCKITLTRKKRK